MKKLLLISLLTFCSPIFSMLRTQRIGTILLRNSAAIARTMATSQPPKGPLHNLDVQGLTDCLDKLKTQIRHQRNWETICASTGFAGAVLAGSGVNFGIPMVAVGILGAFTIEDNYRLEEKIHTLREELEKIKQE